VEAEAARDLAGEAAGERAARGRAGAAAPTQAETYGRQGRPQAEAVEVVSAVESRAAPAVGEAGPGAVADSVAAEEQGQGRDQAVVAARVLAVAVKVERVWVTGVAVPAEVAAGEVGWDLAAVAAERVDPEGPEVDQEEAGAPEVAESEEAQVSAEVLAVVPGVRRESG